MLDSEVDTLFDITMLHLFIDDNTDGALRDVIDNTGLAVVDLVWHTVGCQFPFPIAPILSIVIEIGRK